MLNTPDIEQKLQKVKYNELESIAEWLLEDVMEWEEAIPEQDQPEQDQKKGGALQDWVTNKTDLVDYIVFYNNAKYTLLLCDSWNNPILDISTPPPDFQKS